MRHYTALFLALLLAGCANTAATVVSNKLPAVLMEDCEHPAMDVMTNGGLVRTIKAYQLALDLCNEDKKALRKLDSKNP